MGNAVTVRFYHKEVVAAELCRKFTRKQCGCTTAPSKTPDTHLRRYHMPLCCNQTTASHRGHEIRPNASANCSSPATAPTAAPIDCQGINLMTKRRYANTRSVIRSS